MQSYKSGSGLTICLIIIHSYTILKLQRYGMKKILMESKEYCNEFPKCKFPNVPNLIFLVKKLKRYYSLININAFVFKFYINRFFVLLNTISLFQIMDCSCPFCFFLINRFKQFWKEIGISIKSNLEMAFPIQMLFAVLLTQCQQSVMVQGTVMTVPVNT